MAKNIFFIMREDKASAKFWKELKRLAKELNKPKSQVIKDLALKGMKL